MRLQDKVAIVTGGAQGIGQATSRCLAKQGAKVMIVDLAIEQANEVVDGIRSEGYEARAMKVDITRFDETTQMAKATLDKFGQIDILVNVAGGVIPGKMVPFSESTEEGWDQLIKLNLYGTLNCTRAVINHMIERRCGKIINFASICGMTGQINGAGYAAAKGGVIAFIKGLAKEVAKHNINVNCISPGTVATPRVLTYSKEILQKIVDATYAGRLAEPEEMANVVLFLASDEASYIMGENVVADGGELLGPE